MFQHRGRSCRDATVLAIGVIERGKTDSAPDQAGDDPARGPVQIVVAPDAVDPGYGTESQELEDFGGVCLP